MFSKGSHFYRNNFVFSLLGGKVVSYFNPEFLLFSHVMIFDQERFFRSRTTKNDLFFIGRKSYAIISFTIFSFTLLWLIYVIPDKNLIWKSTLTNFLVCSSFRFVVLQFFIGIYSNKGLIFYFLLSPQSNFS